MTEGRSGRARGAEQALVTNGLRSRPAFPGCCRFMSVKIAISYRLAQAHADGHGMGIRGPRPQGPAFIALPEADQRKGDKEVATSIKRVRIESAIWNNVTSEERGTMKTAVKDATLPDTEAIYLASVILGVAWLFV